MSNVKSKLRIGCVLVSVGAASGACVGPVQSEADATGGTSAQGGTGWFPGPPASGGFVGNISGPSGGGNLPGIGFIGDVVEPTGGNGPSPSGGTTWVGVPPLSGGGSFGGGFAPGVGGAPPAGGSTDLGGQGGDPTTE